VVAADTSVALEKPSGFDLGEGSMYYLAEHCCVARRKEEKRINMSSRGGGGSWVGVLRRPIAKNH